MGLCKSGSLATSIVADKYLTAPIPNEWSLEDAATVPAAYTSILYAFDVSIFKNKMFCIIEIFR